MAWRCPPPKRHAIDSLIYGTNAKLITAYTRRSWRDIGGSGAAYADLPHVLNTWEQSPTEGAADRGLLCAYMGGQRGIDLGQGTVAAQAASFLGDAEQIFPGLGAAARREGGAVVARRAHWPSEVASRGSYVCNHPGYFTTIQGHEGTQTGNLYWAGEHTDSFYDWQGFMEGALNSGIRAADEVLADVKVGRYG